jgi:beta-glucanase (GH16 family)
MPLAVNHPVRLVYSLLLSGGLALACASGSAAIFQAEDYSAAFDTTPGNTGKVYRSQNVDIQACSDSGGGYNVGWIEASEWLSFNNLVIPTSGDYMIRARVASPTGAAMVVDLNAGAIKLAELTLPNTGGWQSWSTVTKVVKIDAGTYNLGVYATSGGWNFNWIEIVSCQNADCGLAVPGRVEAEQYSRFFDTTSGNTGGALRNDNVDIEVTSDAGGGYNIGWIAPSETLGYNINVAMSGRYKITARTATPNTGKFFRLKLDGNDLGQRLELPTSGAWQNWRDASIEAPLTQGVHQLDAYFDTGDFNLNYLDFDYLGPIEAPSDWKLVWSDEFSGNQLDLSKWSRTVSGTGGGNSELQYYTDRTQNSYVSNGTLKITALKETFAGPDGTRNYTSGRLDSRNKGDWKYGRMEISARLPYGQGIWPAIWMLPTDNIYGGWAASGEIDIMEAVNTTAAGGNDVHGTLHYGGAWPNNTYTGKPYTPTTSIVNNFHQYTVEWEPGEIRWYVDGKLYQTQNAWHSGNANAKYPAPFDQRFYMILNLAVGGNWPGNPNGTTQFPQTMEVDYVRVFQKTTGASSSAASSSASSSSANPALKVMSYNLRTTPAGDEGERFWDNRKAELVRAIHTQTPDIIGLQEATREQHDYVKAGLGSNWGSSPLRQIVYRRDLFEVAQSGVVELVADVWGKRSSEWLKLRRTSDKREFLFFNNHWGVDGNAQQGSANILRDTMGGINQNWALPTILLGDLNAPPGSGPINTLANQTPLQSQFSGNTFNGWNTSANVQLDYVFTSKLTKLNCNVISYREGTTPPSDHFPIYCELRVQ